MAAYKACELVRALRQRGAAVVVVMTEAACEFVTPLTFQTLSGNPVVRGMWGDQAPALKLPSEAARKLGGKVEHVDVAEAADLVVIAPATADLIARLVHGEAPDALTAVALATPAPLVVCPSMDLEMWRHPATQENVRTLARRGARIVGPESGPLASGLEGLGRLASLEAMIAGIEAGLVRRASMRGLRVLVGAGRTEEPLDPVRVLTNRSSGRMGMALAAAARDRGAEVVLVHGAVSVDPPARVRRVPVVRAQEMERALVAEAKDADVVVMAAAVSDYRPARTAKDKLARGTAARTVELTPNPDILAGLGRDRRPGQVLVGFALETRGGVARARAKLRDKGVDLIVLNTVAEGLGGDSNTVTLVEAASARRLPKQSKREAAEAILDRALELRAGRVRAGAARRPAAARAARTAPRRG